MAAWQAKWDELKPVYDQLITTPATVLDPFGGSGTTSAKAEQLGRRSIAIEIKAEYCKLILKRCHQQQII
jgi:adenine specific DNA methylase Mod